MKFGSDPNWRAAARSERVRQSHRRNVDFGGHGRRACTGSAATIRRAHCEARV